MFNFFVNFTIPKTLIWVMVFLATSCTSMEFISSSKDTHNVSAQATSERLVEVEVTKGFYFWGMSPEKPLFNFEQEFRDLGVSNPAYVTIEQKFTLSDVLLTVFTFGLYSPVTYKVGLLSNGKLK